MKSIQDGTPRFAVLLAVLLVGSIAAYAAPPTPVVFSTGVFRPTGITAAQNLLLVSPQSCPVAFNEASSLVCGAQPTDTVGPTTIYSLSSSGAATAFTSLEAGAVEDQEIYLATATYGHGWGAGDVYAARGKYVYKIAAGGVAIPGPITDHFSTPCTADNQHVGITFDNVGTFGYNMIVTCGEEATTWEVNPAGVASPLLATLPYSNDGIVGVTEGPAVTPAGFCSACNLPASYPPLSGSISAVGSVVFAAQENQDTVSAVTSGSTVSTFNHSNTFFDPEGVIAVPPQPCTFAPPGAQGAVDTGYAYFIADQANNVILGYPTANFDGLGGNLLVPNENPHATDPGHSIYMVDGTNGAIGVFDTADSVPGNPGEYINHEGSAFVTCLAPPATMPIVKHSSDENTPPNNSDFVFGLFPRTDNSFPAPPADPLGYTDDTPADRGAAQTTGPENDLKIPLADGPFNAAVCELAHTAGWTFTGWTVSFTPSVAGDFASAPYHPTGETTDPQIYCVNLTITPGTTEVDLNVTDTPPAKMPTHVTTGIFVEDSSRIIPAAAVGPAPTGTVTYSFFNNGGCSGTPSGTQTVTVSSTTPPNSTLIGPVPLGAYSYNASYSGDGFYAPSGPSSCEPFLIGGID